MSGSQVESIHAAFGGGWTNLYVIGPAGGPYKVGYAGDVARRLKGLQTGNPLELAVEHVVPVPEPDATTAELYAHWLLRARRLNGEWFDVARSEAVAAVQLAVRGMDQATIPIVLKPDAARPRKTLDGLANLISRGAASPGQIRAGQEYRILYTHRARAEGGARLCALPNLRGGHSMVPLAGLDQLRTWERLAAGIGAATGLLLLRQVAGEGHPVRAMMGESKARKARLEGVLMSCLSAIAEHQEKNRATAA